VVKFVFSHSKLRKQPFLLEFSKSTTGLSPPSDVHACEPNKETAISITMSTLISKLQPSTAPLNNKRASRSKPKL